MCPRLASPSRKGAGHYFQSKLASVWCWNPNQVFASTGMKVGETNQVQTFHPGSDDTEAWEGAMTPKSRHPRTSIKTNSPIKRRGPKHILPKFRTRDYKILPTNSNSGSTLKQELNDGFDGHASQAARKHMSGKRRRRSPLLLGLSSLVTSAGQQVADRGATFKRSTSPEAMAESDVMPETSNSPRQSEAYVPGPTSPVGHLFHSILPSIECSDEDEAVVAPHLSVSSNIPGQHQQEYTHDDLLFLRHLTDKPKKESQAARFSYSTHEEESKLLHCSSRHVQPSQRSSPENVTSSMYSNWADQTWSLGNLRPTPPANWMRGSAKRSSACQDVDIPGWLGPADRKARVASRDNSRGVSVGGSDVEDGRQDCLSSLQYLQQQQNHQGRQSSSVKETGRLQALRPKAFVAE